MPLGGSVSSCTYDADSDKITVVFTTPAQAGFRLTITGKDRYGVAFTKVQNASGLTPLVPTASPTNFEISTASDANGDGRIGTLTPTLSADLPTGATHLQYSVDGGAWVAVTDGATSFTPTLTVGSRTIRVVGANANGRAADSTAASMTLDVRTDGPGTLANWGDGSIAPTQQSTQYTTSFTAPDGFGGSVTNLTVTAPLGGTINSAQYNSTTGKIDVTYTTPAQAGFRLTLSFTDAYEVTKTKTQIVSNLATLVPTASPTGVALTSGTIVDGVAKISTTTPTVTATLPAGATHLRYRVDEGNWTAVADGDTSFSTAALTAGDHTVDVIGANANGQAADSTAVRLNLNLRTTGPGTIGWSTAPTQQSTQYTKELTATNGFGGAVSSLACDAPLGGSVSSCTYDATTDTITATFTTPAQAGFRLRIQGTDAHGVPFSKVINASGLTS